jgi:hypothetical protein
MRSPGTVKVLTVGGAAQPAGTYTATTAKWIEGTGRVIVRPQVWRPT